MVILAIGRHDSTAGLPGPFAAREAVPRTRQSIGDLLLPARPEPEVPELIDLHREIITAG